MFSVCSWIVCTLSRYIDEAISYEGMRQSCLSGESVSMPLHVLSILDRCIIDGHGYIIWCIGLLMWAHINEQRCGWLGISGKGSLLYVTCPVKRTNSMLNFIVCLSDTTGPSSIIVAPYRKRTYPSRTRIT